MAKAYRLQLIRGRIGTSAQQRAALDCLNLTKINDVKIVNDSPAMRGQIFKLQHLLKIEPSAVGPVKKIRTSSKKKKKVAAAPAAKAKKTPKQVEAR
jgi:large subunit ribosomal protein L30